MVVNHNTVSRLASTAVVAASLSLAASVQAADAQSPDEPLAYAHSATASDSVGLRHGSFLDAEARDDSATERNSSAMMYNGITITAIGVVNLVCGTVALLEVEIGPKENYLNPVVVDAVGGSMLAIGSVLSAVGIPLWAYGAATPDGEQARAVELQIGAGSGSITWQF